MTTDRKVSKKKKNGSYKAHTHSLLIRNVLSVLSAAMSESDTGVHATAMSSLAALSRDASRY